MSTSSVSLWTDSVSSATGTRAAPTTDATEGFDLGGVKFYRVILSADSGQTLDGTGTVDAYVYSPGLGRWCADPDLTFTVTASGVTWVNKRDRAYVDLAPAPFGRAVFAPNGVGRSSGGLTVQIEAFYK